MIAAFVLDHLGKGVQDRAKLGAIAGDHGGLLAPSLDGAHARPAMLLCRDMPAGDAPPVARTIFTAGGGL